MKKLTEREEQLMQVVWQTDGAFIRDIVEALPDPKPHYNTVATIVKILVKKGFLKTEKLGNTDRYSALIPKEAYREDHMEDIKEKYFGNSFTKMMTHFAKQEKLSEKEVEELIALIQSKKH
jgi:predicted transcriptional regulator